MMKSTPPLSNWTELDIWQYIHLEKIPIVPLYLSAKRPVVERDGVMIMVDDDRLPLKEGEEPEILGEDLLRHLKSQVGLLTSSRELAATSVEARQVEPSHGDVLVWLAGEDFETEVERFQE